MGELQLTECFVGLAMSCASIVMRAWFGVDAEITNFNITTNEKQLKWFVQLRFNVDGKKYEYLFCTQADRYLIDPITMKPIISDMLDELKILKNETRGKKYVDECLAKARSA